MRALASGGAGPSRGSAPAVRRAAAAARAARAAAPLQPRRGGAPRRRGPQPCAAVAPTAFSYETQRLVKLIATRQAVKTLLNYLSETNGEQHLWLHNFVADHPLPLSGETDADEWVARLATCPLTTVQDPRRSSVPTAVAAAAVLQGEREVSPRDVAERVLALRAHIAEEMSEGLGRMPEANAAVRRRALELSVVDFKPPAL
ncbi:hypothetical protein Rsub_11524 [Raphidocelis subcapitata]|uniref:Uncharacterized protein n=1 Tax=Raphidocelis subcapitata TaxID=307507 RepID=A0A2V0PGJ8_9CHLO|nr:hypothetical protein Rsub_11524 [Raphidocelis subcapitata]|eukprot:GBF98886.1 hypothetical protein Rsub_11524 [Raphidocelis subcapitata]